MLDFLNIMDVTTKNSRTIRPDFGCEESPKDLMTKGGAFYSIWDANKLSWGQRRTDVVRLINASIREYLSTQDPESLKGAKIMWATNSSNGVMADFTNACRNSFDDNFVPLNSKLIFKSDPYVRENYSTFRLNYDIIEGPTPFYDKLIGTLYSEEERAKIEWFLGAALNGDGPKIQKFLVLYGNRGTGKSTVINIVNKLFKGYTSSFNAADLGSASKSFSMEPFKNNPVIAYQHDGDLSRIEDNTKLNSIISHEIQPMNEKNKSIYQMRITSLLIMGTNERVKITNAKSGLLRRLLDVNPTGNLLPADEYDECMEQIDFELGAIASKCIKRYKSNKRKYDKYIPIEMMASTNDFFDFVSSYYEEFVNDDATDGFTRLSVAWERYKKYADDAGLIKRLQRRDFANELGNYFKEDLHDEMVPRPDGSREHVRSIYRGFDKSFMFLSKNKGITTTIVMNNVGNTDISVPAADEIPDWLSLKNVGEDSSLIVENPFDLYFAESKASYAVSVKNKDGSIREGDTKPKVPWDKCKTKLKSLDTTLEHYVHCQEEEPNLIFLDFDDVDPETGKKSLQRNLRLAKKFPKTYAETSRSGNGLHLYYIYDGDPGELSSLYDTHVEIKRLTGDSSLRRRLYLCNNLPIAHINSGLPLKEVKKKVLDEHQINDEKHLRNKIKKALRREVHANTRPSIDYIKMVLTEAYDSGMKYDVSDLRQSVMNFAAGSTNQAEYCMQVVLDLPFCSEEPSENVQTNGYLEKPIAFFDWEIFPNLSIMCYKLDGAPGGKEAVVKLINPTSNEVSDFFAKHRAVGFNNLGYDNHISYARILGYSNDALYELSQALIPKSDSERKDKNSQKTTHKIEAGFREAKNISYTDVLDFSNTKQSLKKFEIELGIPHQEFPLPWDQPVPENMWELAADYCANDVCATEIVFHHLESDWEARQVLAKISGLTVNDRTNAHTCRIIFGNNRNPQSAFNYPELSKEFPGYEFNQYGIDPERYNIGNDGKTVKTSGKSIFMGDDPSEGGYVYYETGIHHNVALLDIASLHPTTIEVLQLFGPEYTARFSEIKNARVAIKHKDWNAVRGYLGGAIAPFIENIEAASEEEQQKVSDSLSYAFKIVINSVFGLTAANFPNPCRDPRNVDNVVAKRGALFMILLKHEVQKRGFTVAHVKTDSIKIPDATPEIIDFVMAFGKKYGYSFEHEATYDRMCLVNKSVYICKYDDQGERTKGGRHANAWSATGAEFQHPYIFKTLFSHEPIEFKDYCETKSVAGNAAIYLDFNEDLTKDISAEIEQLKDKLAVVEKGKMDVRREIKSKQEELDSIHSLSFVGKCGLFVPVEPGAGGGYLVRVEGSKIGAVAGTKGYRWLESSVILDKHMEDKIDMTYYRALIDTSIDHIAEYGDAEEFING